MGNSPAAAGAAVSLEELSSKLSEYNVTSRTIRRDIDALEAVLFSIYKERDEDDVVRWRLLSNVGIVPRRAA